MNRPSFISGAMNRALSGFLLVLCCLGSTRIFSRQSTQSVFDIKANYRKVEYHIPMRDGVKLFTSVYIPRDQSQRYPIMLNRTPYSVAPYGADAYRQAVGPSTEMAREGFIFVYQDARGRYMSEGEIVHMRPEIDNKTSNQIDESSDTYDTVDWLLKNIPNNNGRVGLWGISYPGFYTTVGLIQAHPAVKAASPQAPMADIFIGDDAHHNGALFLDDTVNFLSFVGQARPKPTTITEPLPVFTTPDNYKLLLDMGPLPEVNEKYFKHEIAFWDEIMQHPNYDSFWKSRNPLSHLKNITPAVMVVGGWFDAEDLYGALHTYQAIEAANPKTFNVLVMGPWFHGGWARSDGSRLGDISFGSKTSEYYRQNIELQFFNFYLKDKGDLKLPEATVFNTGANEWKSYDHWPPKNTEQQTLYLHANGKLSFEAENSVAHPYDEYVSDPSKPVPYTAATTNERGVTFMDEDQRFAGKRPDVLVYESEVLDDDVTLAAMRADLFVSSTGTDADFVVKLIDVFPNNTPDPQPNPSGVHLGGYEMMIRGEVMRAKFRNSFENPEPLVPNKIAEVGFNLQDIDHTFRKGHKIMIQVQSSWFPLVDRNPQKFVDINNAKASDFQIATQRIYHSGKHLSRIHVGVLK